MNQGTINFILQQMTGCLNNSQMMRLQNTLNESLQLAEDKSVERSSSELLEAFSMPFLKHYFFDFSFHGGLCGKVVF